MTEDNEIRYTKGDKQITDVRFSGSNLQFFNEKKLLFSYDLSIVLFPIFSQALILRKTRMSVFLMS